MLAAPSRSNPNRRAFSSPATTLSARVSAAATTVDSQCGSSQQSAHFAAQAVMSGAHDIVVAAGIRPNVDLAYKARLHVNRGITAAASQTATFDVTGSNIFTVNSLVTANPGLGILKIGTGTLTLTGDASTSGGLLTVQRGTVAYRDAGVSNFNTSAVVVNEGGVLILDNTGTVNVDNRLRGGGLRNAHHIGCPGQ